jgi:GNAT superfamily N-acetyltransferase
MLVPVADGSGAATSRSGLEPAAGRTATAEDVPRLAGALAAAFHQDPAFAWMLPADHTRRTRLQRFFAVELRALGLSCVWTTDDLAGAVVATPPGKRKLAPTTMLRNSPAYAQVFGRRLPNAAALLVRMESRHPRPAHCYIPFVGVVPERQGAGLGARLVRHALDRCDGERLPAYLEATTERNAVLYERLGFRLISELRYGGAEPLRLMLRAPRTQEATTR